MKCSGRKLQLPHRVPFTKKKMPWCPCPFKNEASGLTRNSERWGSPHPRFTPWCFQPTPGLSQPPLLCWQLTGTYPLSRTTAEWTSKPLSPVHHPDDWHQIIVCPPITKTTSASSSACTIRTESRSSVDLLMVHLQYHGVCPRIRHLHDTRDGRDTVYDQR